MKSEKQKRENFGAVNISKSVSDSINMDSPLMNTFIGFRADLDAHQDKYERLVKTSRDITIISKRIIFNLHRCVGRYYILILVNVGASLVSKGRFRPTYNSPNMNNVSPWLYGPLCDPQF